MKILSVLHSFRRLFLTADINNDAIRLLEISRDKQSFQIEKTVTHILPPGCVSQQRILDPLLFAEHLSQSIDSLKPRQHRVRIALPVNQVIVKTLSLLPDLSAKEMQQQIQQEVARSAPAPLQDIYWDYQKTLTEDKTEKITLVIGQRATIQRYQEAFAHAGLTLHTVDIESFVLARAWYPRRLQQQPPYTDNTTEALLFVRSQLITLIILRGTHALYARAWPLDPLCEAYQSFTQAAQTLWESLSSSPDITTPSYLWIAGTDTLQESLLNDVVNVPISVLPGDHSLLLLLGLITGTS